MRELAGQMSIFDILTKTINFKPVEELTIEEVLDEMIKATGLKFTLEDRGYVARDKKHKKEYSFGFSRYSCDGFKNTRTSELTFTKGQKFIFVDYKHNLGGSGRPCDSLEDAVKEMKRILGKTT